MWCDNWINSVNKSLLVAAIVLSNCITWTASRHHYTHNVSGHRSRHRRQGAGLFLSASYVIPRGEGDGWGEWGEVSTCSRTCGGGVASQKRICLRIGSDGRPQCTGGDTKYFSCQTQDCPEGSTNFRAQQCSEFDDQDFRGFQYKWVPYTKAPNPCELNCMPHGERFYYRHKAKVIDGTRCNDDSFDVCVDGQCQPVGCDMMLGSTAREDKCRECRGNGANCHTISGLYDSQDLVKGYNDILLIPQGSTTIIIEEIAPSNNYLALRAKNGTYYLNGHYHIDFPRRMEIAGAMWYYDRSQRGRAAPDKLRCLGPTTEPLYLALLLQDENVGIQYEYSVPNTTAPPTDKRYNWVHEKFEPCSVSCGGGFQTRNVTCRSREELELVDDSLCDEGLKPVTNQSCNTDPCPPTWVEGTWGACSKRCGKGGVMSRAVTCEKVVANGYSSIVPDSECFDLLGPKPELFRKCNEDSPCPKWFTGPWKPCNKLCDQGKQTRQVVCYEKKDRRIEVLPDEDCAEEKPEAEMPCFLKPCSGVDWITTHWTGCDSCMSKNRTRKVLCATKEMEVYDDKFCAHHTKPVEQEPCDQLPACEVNWYATQWSKCSVECGEGVQTRRVFCGIFDGNQVQKVNDSMCNSEEKYKDTKPCVVPKEKCPAQWFVGPWTDCSKPCDGGERSRFISCLKGDTPSTECSAKQILSSSEACNLHSCNIDLILPVKPSNPPIISEEDYCDYDEEFPEVGVESDHTTREDDSKHETMQSDSPFSGSGTQPFAEMESTLFVDTGSGFGATTDDLRLLTTDELLNTEGSGMDTTGTLIFTDLETSSEDGSTLSSEDTSETDSTGSSSGTNQRGATATDVTSTEETETVATGQTDLTASTETDGTNTTPSDTGVTSADTSTEFTDSSSTETSSGTGVTSTDSTVTAPTTEDAITIANTTDTEETGSTSSGSTEKITTGETDNLDSTVTEFSATKSTDETEIPDSTESETTDETNTTPTHIPDATESSSSDMDATGTGSTESMATDESDTTRTGSDATAESTTASSTEITGSTSSDTEETGTSSTDESTSTDDTATTSTADTDETESSSEQTITTSTDLEDTESTQTDESSETTSTDVSGSTETPGTTDTESSISSTEISSTGTTIEAETDESSETSSTDVSGSTETPGTTNTESSTDISSTGTTIEGTEETETTGKETITTPTAGTESESTTVQDASSTDVSGSTESTSTEGTSTESSVIPSAFTETTSTGDTISTDSSGSTEQSTSPEDTTRSGDISSTMTEVATESSTTESTDVMQSSTTEKEIGTTAASESESTVVPTTESSTSGSELTSEAATSTVSSISVESTTGVTGTTMEGSTVTEGSTTESVTSTEVLSTSESTESSLSSGSTTSETSTEYSTGVTEVSETTTEAFTSGLSTSDSAVLIFTSTRSDMKCIPRKKHTCAKSMFGCCPDKKTPAKGPFDEGCDIPATCKDSEYGCCPDKVSLAKGLNYEGCPTTPCAETLFGCCDSDNITAAEGNDQEGCPPPPPACKSSQYGCCADNETEATGPEKEGCPETMTTTPSETTVTSEATSEEISETNETSTESETSISTETTESEISTERSSISETGGTTSTLEEGCLATEYGCCFDNETVASGPNGLGCPCYATEFGCCPDETTPATGPGLEGCQGDCRSSQYGCCSDNETPAHGPDFEGCCLKTAFGCCPDNRKPAEGPHLEGCGCQSSQYGCCPDNVTPAQGPANKGCGCQYTQYGCCPDWHTEATGPDYEGCTCSTYQFGCCPDGVSIAKGPEHQGCHCRYSNFGCCSDGETAATSADASGCDCAASKYGCCLDGQTEAKGPKFFGCTDVPENKQSVCTLPTDSGPCHNYTAYWFFDVAYGGCSRFWYGGCDGNGNRFATKEDCEDVCVQPPPKDVCKLPGVKGICEGDSIHWYYNNTLEQCIPFTYGGCLGNANNFDTRELCQKQCEPDRTIDQCFLPIEEGPCAGNYSRWGFNKDTKKCEQYTWGGCEGNNNRFSTEAACQLRCSPPGVTKPQCTQPQEVGSCTDTQALWSFSQSENRCVPFYYSGCGGNDNRYYTLEECEKSCPSAYVPNKCTLPASTGECSNYRERWFYDTLNNRCRLFYYGGCGGNENNFESESMCESSCSEARVTTTTVRITAAAPTAAPQAVRPQPEPNREAFCFLEIDAGTCNHFEERWAYDSALGRCKTFQYGGCGGNQNNFPEEHYCIYYCHPVQDICQLPMVSGPCDDSMMMWFYDSASDSCSQFTYGGCEGNDNRFESREACEGRCRSSSLTTTTIASTSTTAAVHIDNRIGEKQSPECTVSASLEACSTAGEVWYYDSRQRACISHMNGESGDQCRHTGVFLTHGACERNCGFYRGIDACAQPVDSWPCDSSDRGVYFVRATGDCQFLGQGCLSGANSFTSLEECFQVCNPGRLSTTATTTVVPIASTTAAPQQWIPPECVTPSALEPCGVNVTVFYYDSDRRVCQESDIGGCQYANSYRTEEECERTCGAFRGLDVCGSRLDPGPCRAAIPKVYWDMEAGSCGQFAYGGCGGSPNRFSSVDECEEVCGNTRPDTNEVIPRSCGVYEEECRRLRCSGGVERTYTREGCTRCACAAPPPADCGPARARCDAILCSFGVQRTVDNDGCQRCDCYDDPCLALNCSSTERCVSLAYRDPATQEPRYSAECVPEESNEVEPDCERYRLECAQLSCEFGVQRTRVGGGCERCACVPIEIDCSPLADECDRLKCNYGVLRNVGDDGCPRCRCADHPCGAHTCPGGQRCVAAPYKDPITNEPKFTVECRNVDKAGMCPAEEAEPTEGCREECKDDADCRGVAKCCHMGCNQLCREPLPPTAATPATIAPDIPRAPEADPQQENNVTVSEGGKATLRCLFHGNPPPKISWQRGELTIDGNSGRYRLLSDGALEIVSLYRSDSGVYICVADNGLGTATQEIHLVVNADINRGFVNATSAADSIVERESEARSRTLSTGSLTNAGLVDPVQTSVGIAGEENAVVTGELGKSLSIRCLAYGYPPPFVYWYHNQGMVPFNDAVYLARDNVLLIRSLSVETLGDYTCQAYNTIGKPVTWVVAVKAYRPEGILIEHEYLVSQEAITAMTRAPQTARSTTPTTITTTTTTELPVMRIFKVPVVTHIQPPNGPLSENDDLLLACEVDGFPDPEVYWTKDGERLYPDDRITISGSSSVSRLSIVRVAVKDGGLYACHASNEYSSDKDTTQITVNQGVVVPAKCTDNPFFANCNLIVRNRFCRHKYYSNFCCKSCVEAGQLDPQEAELQADQPFRRK